MKKTNKLLSTILASTIAFSGLTAFTSFADDEVSPWHDTSLSYIHPETGEPITASEYYNCYAMHEGPGRDMVIEGKTVENCIEKYGTFILAVTQADGNVVYEFNLQPVEGDPSKGIQKALTYAPTMNQKEFEQYEQLCKKMNATGAKNYGYLLDDYKNVKEEYVDILKDSQEIIYSNNTHSYKLNRAVSETTYGDVNLNGVINSADALAILKDVVNIPIEENETRYERYADYDQNGEINTLDALGVLKQVVGLK